MRGSGRWWALVALMAVVLSTTATACSRGGSATDAVGQTATPTVDAPGSAKGNVPPPVTQSPAANVLFEWVPFADEASRTSAALPEHADPFENPIEGPDGETILSRGYVHEHAAGVIGFEVIERFATVDDFDKLAELLADSVGGAVESVEPADVDRPQGVDGEISYGDDETMLFRILVLNDAGDVWNGFVGGPAADRERLESEFARLTVSADLRSAFDWVYVTDEPSGIVVPMRGAAEPQERLVTLADGSTMLARAYEPESAFGFMVLDTDTDSYGLDHAVAERADSVGGVVESSEPIELGGYDAVEALIADGTAWTWVYRIVLLEEQVLVLYAGNRSERLDDTMDFMTMVTDAVTMP